MQVIIYVKKFFSIIMVISFVAAITACQSSIPEYVRVPSTGTLSGDVLVYMKGLPLDKGMIFIIMVHVLKDHIHYGWLMVLPYGIEGYSSIERQTFHHK